MGSLALALETPGSDVDLVCPWPNIGWERASTAAQAVLTAAKLRSGA